MAPSFSITRWDAALAILNCAATWQTASAEEKPAASKGGAPAFLAFEMKADWSTRIHLQSAASDLLGDDVKDAHLLISSTGGDVATAVAGYDVLRALPVTLATYNLGDVDPAASMLLMAGENRACAPSSRLLFHQVRAEIRNADLSRADLQDRVASVQSDIDRVKAICSDNTHIDAAMAETSMAPQNWVDPATALKLGGVQTIASIRVPASASFKFLPVPGDD